MAEPPRDWDKELAEIDKIIASGKSAPPPAAPTRSAPAAAAPASAAPSAAPARPSGGRAAIIGTWFRALLGASLLAALLVWPFAHYCGGGLALYLGAVALSVITALWTLGASWTHRRGLAHTLGIGLLISSLALGAMEILPRVGYAKVTQTWLCPAIGAPTAAPVSAAPTSAAPASTVPTTAAPGASASTAPTTPAPVAPTANAPAPSP